MVEPDATVDMQVDARPDMRMVDPDMMPDQAIDMAPDMVDMAPDMAIDMAPDMPVPCVEGTVQPCGTDEGECVAGEQTCNDVGEFGPCVGAVDAQPEACDGLDNDCDGVLDEEAPLEPCGSDVGACMLGNRSCVDGAYGPCEGAVTPIAETCDAVDNDCDGSTDEEVLSLCDPAPDSCSPGTSICMDGVFDMCEQSLGAVAERCNGGDDDCDGNIDEGLERPCGGVMGCAPGVQRCVAGLWTLCEDEPLPAEEICDGLDNDCDGNTDEALTRACGVDMPPCVLGQETCEAGEWINCDAAVLPGEEQCNAVDDDCDGVLDEEIAPQPCGVGEGVCEPGLRQCIDGVFAECDGGVDPEMGDPCNGADDDCDSLTDEDGAQPCGTDVGACQMGVSQCIGGAPGACEGAIEPVPETCNGIDDDCDGPIDEGIDGNPLACPLPGAVGLCEAEANCAFQRCLDGFIDVDLEAGNGCERGCAAAGEPVNFDPLDDPPSIRLAVQGRNEALVYLQPNGEVNTPVLVTAAGARNVGVPGRTVHAIDVAPSVAAGWLVAAVGTNAAGGSQLNWVVRAFDGEAIFGGERAFEGPTQVAVAQHAPSSRFAMVTVNGEDDAGGQVHVTVQHQSEPGAIPIDPVLIEAQRVRLSVRPVIAGTTEGFVVAYVTVDPAIVVAYLDLDGRLVRRLVIPTLVPSTDLALGRIGRDARLAARLGLRTLIQPLRLEDAPEELPIASDNGGLNARFLDVVSTENGFMITFINPAGNLRGRLLAEDGSYAAPSFAFLGELEPAGVQTVHAVGDGRRVALAWSADGRGRRIALDCE
jgi:hypothetical protein